MFAQSHTLKQTHLTNHPFTTTQTPFNTQPKINQHRIQTHYPLPQHHTNQSQIPHNPFMFTPQITNQKRQGIYNIGGRRGSQQRR
jgi:hypothetical protein